MKQKIIIAAMFVTVTVGTIHQTSAFSNSEITVINKTTQTESFKVYGNCGMCKNRIETALKDVKGVKSAKWDVDTKIMKVSFNEDQISLKEIKEKIAQAGHDTEENKADDKTYENLPGCCQYEREIKN